MLTFISPWSNAYMQSMPWAAGGGDIPGHDPLDPNDARFYEDGEWLQDDGNGGLLRGGDNADAGVFPDNEVAFPSYQIFAERGRTDQPVISGQRDPVTGALVSGRIAVVRLHTYEADTDMVAVLGGLAAGDALSVQDETIAGVVRRVLAARTLGYIQAFVVSTNAAAGTVRFMVRT
jgi:hypothetical protein